MCGYIVVELQKIRKCTEKFNELTSKLCSVNRSESVERSAAACSDANSILPVLAKGGSRDRGGWHINFGINYDSISFGQLSGYIVFCTVPIRGAKHPL